MKEKKTKKVNMFEDFSSEETVALKKLGLERKTGENEFGSARFLIAKYKNRSYSVFDTTKKKFSIVKTFAEVLAHTK